VVQVVSFFEPPPPPPEPPTQQWPVWLGPPDNVIGGVLALGLVVGRSDNAAVTIDSATAYPTGVEFTVDIRWREGYGRIFQRGVQWHSEANQGDELPDELVRLGIQFPDGSKATTLGTALSTAIALRPDEIPEGPILVRRGGAGSTRRWSQTLWLWPMPPEGQLDFVCEWPALGIELSRAEIESTRIHNAARRSQTLWDDGPASAGPGPTPSIGPA
jgi:hypothetical protein